MGVVIDIIGSFIIRGAITVMSLNLLIIMNDSLYRTTEQTYLNEIIAVPAEVMTIELRSAGYKASKNFLVAQGTEVKFCADTGDGTPDTIQYYLGLLEPSTNHKVLYRKINNGAEYELARQVDSLKFTYFDEDGVRVPYTYNSSVIRSIFVQLSLQSKYTITTTLSGTSDSLRLKAYWENHIFPKNL